jgi:hypothetical protein
MGTILVTKNQHQSRQNNQLHRGASAKGVVLEVVATWLQGPGFQGLG